MRRGIGKARRWGPDSRKMQVRAYREVALKEVREEHPGREHSTSKGPGLEGSPQWSDWV